MTRSPNRKCRQHALPREHELQLLSSLMNDINVGESFLKSQSDVIRKNVGLKSRFGPGADGAARTLALASFNQTAFRKVAVLRFLACGLMDSHDRVSMKCILESCAFFRCAGALLYSLTGIKCRESRDSCLVPL